MVDKKFCDMCDKEIVGDYTITKSIQASTVGFWAYNWEKAPGKELCSDCVEVAEDDK